MKGSDSLPLFVLEVLSQMDFSQVPLTTTFPGLPPPEKTNNNKQAKVFKNQKLSLIHIPKT